jgi:hemoglobin-like flavoprotein
MERKMTSEQIMLVQQTFALVQPQADGVAELFYQRLFVLDPSLRPLFKADLSEQRSKLMGTLALVVHNLPQPEKILPAVRTLGRRHAGYGVKDEHYTTVGAALLWTLAHGLGDGFTPEVKTAWTAAYTLLANEMQSASAETVAA